MIATDPAMVLDRLVSPMSPSSCVLFVHPEPQNAIDALRIAVRDRGWPEFLVGRELSAALLQVPPRERGRRASQLMRERVAKAAPTPVVMTGIDVLFDRSLELDPLGMMRQLSRVTPLVVAWPGSASSARLTYGTAEHGQYRLWTNPSVEIVVLP